MPGPALHDFELDTARLVAVIETQNALIAAGLDAHAVIALVADRAAALTGADAAEVTLLEGDEVVHRVASGAAGAATSTLSVPLHRDEQVAGTLTVHADRPQAFGDADVHLLGYLGGLIASTLRHADAERAAARSDHDALTSLGNRRAYEGRLHREVARAQRYGRPLALVTIDVDGPPGDATVRAVAHVLRRLRAADECFRIGGGSFAVVLPDTQPAGARTVGNRLCGAIAEAGGVDVAFGLAHFLGQTAEELHAGAEADLAASRQRAARRSAA